MSGRGTKKRKQKVKMEGAILRQILLEFATYIKEEYDVDPKKGFNIAFMKPEHLVDNFIRKKMQEGG